MNEPSFYFLPIYKKYVTWCQLSQQTIVPTLTVGSTFNVCMFLQPLVPLAAKAKLVPPGPPAPSSHGWLCCRARIVATLHPKTLRTFPGSCSFPFEASPLSSALVRSPRCRPPMLSTWSTTERNKEINVHGEDDSREPAVRVIILFFLGKRRVSNGLCGSYGPSSQGFIYVYHIMSPVVFFSC